MSNETIVRVTADGSGYMAEMSKLQRSNEAFLAAQDTAAKRTQAAQAAIAEAAKNGSDASARQINAFVNSLGRMADVVGKTKSELLAQKAAQLGVTDATAAYIDKIAAAEKAMNAGAHAAEGLSFSTSAARRELLVLAHEASMGNWKRFSGSLMVLGERIDAMSLIFNPITAGIAAVVGGFALLADAAIKGAIEQEKMNAALVMTGNYAGMTGGQMYAMTQAIGQANGQFALAKEALLSLTNSGRFTSSEIQLIGTAATNMADATGQAVKTTIEQFTKLADSPVKASIKLNEQYHYLTVAVYDQIDALQKQGDQVGAANLAEKAYAEALNRRSAEIHQNLGTIESAWEAVKAAAHSAWDAMLDVGRTETPESKLARMQSQIQSITADLHSGSLANLFPGVRMAKEGLLAQLQGELRSAENDVSFHQDSAAGKSMQAQVAAGQIAAKNWLDGFHKQFESQAERRKQEIDQYLAYANRAGLSQSQQAIDIAAINAKYHDKAPKHVKAYTDDAATRLLQSLRDQDAATRAALASSDKLTGAEKQQAEFLQQISDLKGKSILTAEQKSLLANQDLIKAQLAQNVADEQRLQLKKDIEKVEQRSAQVNAQIAAYQQGQTAGYQRQLDAIGMGKDAQQQVKAINSITKEYERLQWQLEKQTPKDARGSSAYLNSLKRIKDGLDQSLQDYSNYYQALKAKQADWRNGASEAFANFRDQASNVADQANQAFTSGFKGMEDALVSFVQTGKLNFSTLANSIIADLARIAIKQAEVGILGSLGSLFGSSLGTGGGAFLANLQGGNSLDNFIGNMGGFGTIPARANGGPVSGGAPYLVGERGPELFVPGASGGIVPNHALSTTSMSGGAPIMVNVSVQADGQKQATGNSTDFMRIGQLVADKTREIMLTELRPGGILSGGA